MCFFFFYQNYAVAGSEREDVGTGDGGIAGGFDVGFDGVHDIVAAHRVGVGSGVLFSCECCVVVEKDRSVASLIQS